MLDALDGTTLTRVYFSTAKEVRQEHRTPFAHSLRHAQRIFCQAHKALHVAPADDTHNDALTTNLERATKLSKLLRFSYSHRIDATLGRDVITSTQEGNWWAPSSCWWCLREKSTESTGRYTCSSPNTRSKLAHEQGDVIKAVGALVSLPAAPRDYRTLATLRSKYPAEDLAVIATGNVCTEQRAGITVVGEQEQEPNVTTD